MRAVAGALGDPSPGERRRDASESPASVAAHTRLSINLAQMVLARVHDELEKAQSKYPVPALDRDPSSSYLDDSESEASEFDALH